MIELIFILIVLEIIIGVWSLVRINNFTKKVSEANSELKASGFTGNISDLKNSLKKSEIREKRVSDTFLPVAGKIWDFGGLEDALT